MEEEARRKAKIVEVTVAIIEDGSVTFLLGFVLVTLSQEFLEAIQK